MRGALTSFALVGAVAAMLLPSLSAAAAERYQPGQVWRYDARQQDEGSRLKIQRIEMTGDAAIYHIALSRMHLRNGQVTSVQHLPVSLATLDVSVRELSRDDVQVSLDQTDEGIAEWRRANGGVFTISMKQIADILDQNLAGGDAETPATAQTR